MDYLIKMCYVKLVLLVSSSLERYIFFFMFILFFIFFFVLFSPLYSGFCLFGGGGVYFSNEEPHKAVINILT